MFPPKKPASLETPPRNFGSIPNSSEMYTYIVIFGFASYMLPLFLFSALGWDASHNGRLTPGVIATMLGVFTAICCIAGRNLWHASIRMHYLMNSLVPFLETKYNIYLYRRSIRDVMRGRVLRKDSEGNLIVFVDWEIIEKEAKNPTGKDLTNEVFLMVRLEDGSYRELSPQK